MEKVWDFCGWKGFLVVWFGYERHNLGSDTKNDVKPKDWVHLRQESEEQVTHGLAHDHAAGAEADSARVSESVERKVISWFLTLELDTEYTTKPKIRALMFI